jgi:hypothetical protein
VEPLCGSVLMFSLICAHLAKICGKMGSFATQNTAGPILWHHGAPCLLLQPPGKSACAKSLRFAILSWRRYFA